jgi:hypothetical protein
LARFIEDGTLRKRLAKGPDHLSESLACALCRLAGAAV